MIISGPKTIDISYGSLFSILRGIISVRDYFSGSKIFPSGSFPGKETVYPSSAANPK